MKSLAIGVGVAMLAMAAASAQEPFPAWVLELARTKLHLKENFERIPNYVCLETVERFQRKPSQPGESSFDTLHFEVAHVGNKDLLSRPGGGQFEDKDLSAYMSMGTLGSGEFSAVPVNLFVADIARITGHNEDTGLPGAGRSYDFEIPAMRSVFQVTTQHGTASVGVSGTFWVDAESLDLAEIEEHAVDMPGFLGMTGIDSTVRYARMQIGNSQVLLPKSAELLVTRLDRSASRNLTEFSGCRAYTADSTIRFGNSAEPSPAKP